MVTWFNKWLLISLVPVGLYMAGNLNGKNLIFETGGASVRHPLHVSVTEINHNASEKVLEISCRIFTDDFEKGLTQNYKTKIDLINPPEREAMEKLVRDFVDRHLVLTGDNKRLSLSYLGYERDNDAIYTYLQVENIPTIKKLEVNNSILHELFTDQINLMHVTVEGKRKSVKLDYPEKQTVFNF